MRGEVKKRSTNKRYWLKEGRLIYLLVTWRRWITKTGGEREDAPGRPLAIVKRTNARVGEIGIYLYPTQISPMSILPINVQLLVANEDILIDKWRN